MTKILDVSPPGDNTTLGGGSYAQSVSGRMLALACSRDGQTVYTGSFANLWVSQDGGQTWDQMTWPQPAPDQFGVPGALGGWQVMDVAVSPTDSQTVLAVTAKDRQRRVKGRGDRGIWRTTDGGRNWTLVHQFPPGEMVGQLAWAPENDQLVYAAGGSALAVSQDGGATFKDVLPGINHVAVAASPPSLPTPPVVYALGQNMMFVSFNGGTKRTDWIQGQVPPVPPQRRRGGRDKQFSSAERAGGVSALAFGSLPSDRRQSEPGAAPGGLQSVL